MKIPTPKECLHKITNKQEREYRKFCNHFQEYIVQWMSTHSNEYNFSINTWSSIYVISSSVQKFSERYLYRDIHFFYRFCEEYQEGYFNRGWHMNCVIKEDDVHPNSLASFFVISPIEESE